MLNKSVVFYLISVGFKISFLLNNVELPMSCLKYNNSRIIVILRTTLFTIVQASFLLTDASLRRGVLSRVVNK